MPPARLVDRCPGFLSPKAWTSEDCGHTCRMREERKMQGVSASSHVGVCVRANLHTHMHDASSATVLLRRLLQMLWSDGIAMIRLHSCLRSYVHLWPYCTSTHCDNVILHMSIAGRDDHACDNDHYMLPVESSELLR